MFKDSSSQFFKRLLLVWLLCHCFPVILAFNEYNRTANESGRTGHSVYYSERDENRRDQPNLEKKGVENGYKMGKIPHCVSAELKRAEKYKKWVFAA